MTCLRHAVSLAALVALTGAGATAGVARADAPAGEPVVAAVVPGDTRWVQGQVTVAAPPEVVWARLQDVAAWKTLMSDIKRLEVKQRRGTRWEVALETRTLPQGALDYHVDVGPSRSVRLWRTGSGVAVQGITMVRPGPTAGESNVVYSLYIRLGGVPSILISERSLREKQLHMVTTTLGDLRRAFAVTTP